MEHARRHNLKRGGGVPHVSLDETALVEDGRTRTWSRSTTR